MVKRKCKDPKFDVIVCCQGQPFHYYHSTLIGALFEYGYQYSIKRKYDTMNFSLKQVFNIHDVGKLTRTNIATTNEIRMAMGLKVENDPEAEKLIKDDLAKHCLSCKSCDPVKGCAGSNGYCSLNSNTVNLLDDACEHYEPF